MMCSEVIEGERTEPELEPVREKVRECDLLSPTVTFQEEVELHELMVTYLPPEKEEEEEEEGRGGGGRGRYATNEIYQNLQYDPPLWSTTPPLLDMDATNQYGQVYQQEQLYPYNHNYNYNHHHYFDHHHHQPQHQEKQTQLDPYCYNSNYHHNYEEEEEQQELLPYHQYQKEEEEEEGEEKGEKEEEEDESCAALERTMVFNETEEQQEQEQQQPQQQQQQLQQQQATTSLPPQVQASIENLIKFPEIFDPIPTPTRRRERGPHSWEFLMRLLHLPSHVRIHLINWESEELYTFRLVSPEGIAQVWFSRKDQTKNKGYANFARCLRYHYNTEALIPVPERQLVYQCGRKAIKFYKNLRKK